MSYKTIYANANDNAFQQRVTAACAQEGTGDPANPGIAMHEVIWPVVSDTGIEAAYASALAGNNPDPGGDETVITDQMILSAVQANTPAP